MPEPNRDENALLKSAFGRTGECPDVALLASAPANPDVRRHLDTCSRCRTEIQLLREFEAAEPRPAELASVQWIESELRRRSPELTRPVGEPALSFWERVRAALGSVLSPAPGRAFALAAICVLIVAGVLYVKRGAEVQRPYRADDATVWRSGRFAALSPAGDLARSPAEFRWEAAPGAATYRLQVMEVDGTVIWSTESAQPNVEIPIEIRSKLTPGRAFQWEVVARNAAGEIISRTNLQNFRILTTNR